MGVFIKFKVLETENLKGKKKCVGILLHYNKLIVLETDYKRNKIRIVSKEEVEKFNNVILKPLEVINEKGVRIQ